jgi:ComF family protein
MKRSLANIKDSLLHLLYPQICAGCGTDALPEGSRICLDCLQQLPETGFERYADNPVEKMLAGRIPFFEASSQFYFSGDSAVKEMIHQFKYNGNRELGFQLGTLMGLQLLNSGRFDEMDALIPLPLFKKKERKRGYNQAAVLCEAITRVLKVETISDVVFRPQAVSSQTHKGREERWRNLEGNFMLSDPAKIAGKHLLLVDDVITTGATLEACATALLQAAGVKLSIATLCYASDI